MATVTNSTFRAAFPSVPQVTIETVIAVVAEMAVTRSCPTGGDPASNAAPRPQPAISRGTRTSSSGGLDKMTCRQNLVLGLFVALSLSPAAAQLTHAASQPGQAAASTNGDVPEITLRRGATSAAGKPAAWKSSSFDAGADIRFKRPGVAAPNAVAAQHASNVTSPNSSSLQTVDRRSPNPRMSRSIVSRRRVPVGRLQQSEQNRTRCTQWVPNVAFAAPQASHATAAPAQIAEARPLAKIAESAYAPVTQAIAAEQIERSNQSFLDEPGCQTQPASRSHGCQ